ncbi:MAG: flagellar hook protein FlgE [Alphaproteobacteria bacterium]|nr:flagellar hook protein FlgE [Alphaproteobacteria bacterium]
MSVFGSLFTAVSAMTAQSQSMGMISNNIANVSTIGYKRTDAAFSSLVTSESRSVLYSPGSVRALQSARIDQQGILQQSNSSTDIAISGNGFFVVKSDTSTTSEPLYTRAGSFSEDASGVLKNASGFFLYGWPLDQNGGLPAAAADISSLVPVDVAFLGGLTQPTSTASMSVNLNSAQTPGAYPVTFGYVPDFTRDLRVYDSLGSGHNLTINFKKHESPTAIALGGTDLSSFTGPLVGNVPGLVAGDEFTVDIPSAAVSPITITMTATTTIADVVGAVNGMVDLNGVPVGFARLNPTSGVLEIKARNLADTLTVTSTVGGAATDLGLGAVDGVPIAPPAAPTLLGTPTSTPNTEGWWNVEFVTDTGAVVTSGSINFDGSGQLNAAATNVAGQRIVNLNNINWANGSALQDIEFDIANFTQFSGEFNVVTSQQNGAELGLRTGIAIDSDGFVTAQFSNGQSARIYKLAVATFANTNGLDQLTGNVYRQSDSSGDFNLREAGTGSAGEIQGGALEASNVDLADEFSKMIVTQRAYSANTKVISTADQMTEELLRLR